MAPLLDFQAACRVSADSGIHLSVEGARLFPWKRSSIFELCHHSEHGALHFLGNFAHNLSEHRVSFRRYRLPVIKEFRRGLADHGENLSAMDVMNAGVSGR